MSVKLSWQVDLAVAVFGDSAPQEVTLAVMRGGGGDRLMGPWRAGLAALEGAVNHGAFCGAKISPTESRMELLHAGVDSHDDVQARFSIAGVDPGAWRIITALAVFFTYGAPAPAVRIIAKSTPQRIPTITETKVWSLPYPALPDRLPFGLEREEEDPGSYDVLVRIRFKKKLDAKSKLQVLLAMSSWSTLLFGGYPNDGEDMTSCSTSSNEAYMVDPRTVEYAAEYRGHSAGLDAAVLMALWFHQKGSAVESVLIE
jgi:hypothetical protein